MIFNIFLIIVLFISNALFTGAVEEKGGVETFIDRAIRRMGWREKLLYTLVALFIAAGTGYLLFCNEIGTNTLIKILVFNALLRSTNFNRYKIREDNHQ